MFKKLALVAALAITPAVAFAQSQPSGGAVGGATSGAAAGAVGGAVVGGPVGAVVGGVGGAVVGAIVGELGMLSPDNKRTQTLECLADGMILSVTYQKVEELYVQNPEFGFYFLRLVSARLFQNLEKLEGEVAVLKAGQAAS